MEFGMRHIALICLNLGLAGCASSGGGLFGSRQKAEPAEPSFTENQPAALSAVEIRKAISGKSWRWSSAKNSGVTLYASDGTSLVQVDGKGNTTGKWSAKDGYLCESFAPAPFLPPGGLPLSCKPITGSGNSFRVGEADFTLA
jgi:hypothetical protein